MLDNIRFVLVETSHPGNIGAAARAMKTMGLGRLELVRPKLFPAAEATARASGAEDLLEVAQVHPDLFGALAGCRLVVGSSARLRSVHWPQLDPRACAETLVREAVQGPVALVFGRERTGLSNSELQCCHYLAHIPTNPAFGSLNLAAAVQVFAYEVLQAHLAGGSEAAVAGGRDQELATAEAMEGFYGHLAETLFELGFADPSQSKKLLRRLRRLFNRARPDWDELNILRGILSAAQGRKLHRQERWRARSPELS
jgi:tRNA (cytidine32/uridine32-2'-O)-methyltransferase